MAVIGAIPKNVLRFKDREEPFAYLVSRSPDVYIISHVTDDSEQIKRDYILEEIDDYRNQLSSDQLEHTFIASMYDNNYMIRVVIQCDQNGESLFDMINADITTIDENNCKLFEYHGRKYFIIDDNPNEAVWINKSKQYDI